MKFLILAIIGLYFASQVIGQSVLTVNTATYFDHNVGGGYNHNNGLSYNGPIFCRDGAETTTYGGPTQATCTSYGFGTPPVDQGRWGQSALGVSTQMSGLGFQGIKGQQVSAGQDFYLGQLTHFNWPIYGGTAATSVNMNIFFSFVVSGQSTVRTQIFTFTMLIDETPNQAPCAYPGTTPCSDKISFNTSFNFATTFTIDQSSGIQYTLVLEGFKESNSSSSSAVSYFISNENENSQAFLFARITEACPSTCVNGGNYVISSDNDCTCDCSSVTCPGVKTTAPNCTCQCPPSKTCANGGVINTTANTCDCMCTNTCPSPQVRSPDDCSCSCPTTLCHAGGSVANPTTCACQCPSTACAITNQVRNSSCDCVCNLSCTSPKVRSNQTGVCGCVCANTCPAGFTINQATCGCDCTRTCVNSVLQPNCTCGPCQGHWTFDNTTGQCTACPASVRDGCNVNERYDNTSCSCACVTLNCNLRDNGQIVDTTQQCACRNCTAGECICGNGRVEPGEQCDTGSVNDTCCQGCKFTTNPCDDGNGCTDNSYCNGNGTCNPGEYKCLASTECTNVTCDPAVGVCTNSSATDGTACGASPHDLCNARCLSGVCDKTPVVCGADNNTQDCYHPACNSSTGMCPYVANNDSSSCSDGNACTTNDACTRGTCVGTPIHCAAPDQCHNATCQFGTCVPFALEGRPCNADSNACTIGDVCSGGICLAGAQKVCNISGQCTGATCNATTGVCSSFVIPNYLNKTCNDNNICTYKDVCVNGTCAGVKNPAYVNATQCGFVPLAAESAKVVKNTSIAIFAAIGAATLIGAIIGLAVLIKRIQAKKLLNPDSWNPDMFSMVGSNPLYQGSSSAVNNALYEGQK